MKSSIHSFVALIHPGLLAAWDISVKESIENLRIAQYGVLRSIMQMNSAFGLALRKSSTCASSAAQSYCLIPFQMSG